MRRRLVVAAYGSDQHSLWYFLVKRPTDSPMTCTSELESLSMGAEQAVQSLLSFRLRNVCFVLGVHSHYTVDLLYVWRDRLLKVSLGHHMSHYRLSACLPVCCLNRRASAQFLLIEQSRISWLQFKV